MFLELGLYLQLMWKWCSDKFDNAAILSFSIRLGTSLFAVFLFNVPGDEMLGNIPRWIHYIILGFIPVATDNVSPSLAVTFVSNYLLLCVFCLRARSACFSCRHLIILLTWHITQCLWWITLSSTSDPRRAAVVFQRRVCSYLMYRHCIHYTTFANHGCMRLYFNDTDGSGLTRLKFVITASCHPVCLVLVTS